MLVDKFLHLKTQSKRETFNPINNFAIQLRELDFKKFLNRVH